MDSDRNTLTRRRFVARSAQLTAGLAVGGLAGLPELQQAAAQRARDVVLSPPALPAGGFTADDYWRFADWLAPYFDALWIPERGLYGSGNSDVGRIYHNSLLLTTHAVAALTGHQGPARNDERARVLARRLCDSPPWSELTEPVEPDPQFHNPGWVESMGTRDAAMDKSIDPKVAEGLMYAWRARDALRLPDETLGLIPDRISRCAHGPFFRFPNVRLNQINWNCELYAHLATVTGDLELLHNDYREQVERFCAGIRVAPGPGGSPNLGPGYRFHYLPGRPPTHPFNLDSSEYANETCHFILYYEQALRAGMPPLAPDHLILLKAWIEHILYAYWTHGGYLNWDTGYGFKRWHAGRTWAFAQRNLLMGRAIHYRERLSCVLHVRPIKQARQKLHPQNIAHAIVQRLHRHLPLAHQLAQRQDEIFRPRKVRLNIQPGFNRLLHCLFHIAGHVVLVVEILDRSAVRHDIALEPEIFSQTISQPVLTARDR